MRRLEGSAIGIRVNKNKATKYFDVRERVFPKHSKFSLTSKIVNVKESCNNNYIEIKL